MQLPTIFSVSILYEKLIDGFWDFWRSIEPLHANVDTFPFALNEHKL